MNWKYESKHELKLLLFFWLCQKLSQVINTQENKNLYDLLVVHTWKT